MAKKKNKIALPPSKVEILAEEILGHYTRCKETGLYCVVDRSLGFYFFDVFRDASWSYAANNKEFDSILLVERLYSKNICKMIKYPVYESSEEMESILKEFSEYTKKDLDKSDFEGSSSVEKLRKTQDYINKISAQVPSIKEVERPAYLNGYNGDKGYPVIALSDIPGEVLKNISYRLAENALSHFSTISFLYDDNFSMKAFPVVVDPDEVFDLIIGFSFENPIIAAQKRGVENGA